MLSRNSCGLDTWGDIRVPKAAVGFKPTKLRSTLCKEDGCCDEKIREVAALRALRAGDDRGHHHDQPLRLLLVLALRADPPGPAPLARHGVDGGVLPAALGDHDEPGARVPALAGWHLLRQPGDSGCYSAQRPSVYGQISA